MSWLNDSPDGVFRDHALSSKIRTEAMEDAIFAQFASIEDGYGRSRGESITITLIDQLPLAARVSDIDNLPSGRPAVSTTQIDVAEWGFAIETTSFERDLTHYDQDNRFQQMLREQMMLTMDKMHADANRLTNIWGVTETASTLTIETGAAGGPATLAANSNLTIAHLRTLHDQLKQNQKAPKFANGMYVGVLTTRGARGIKNDPEYKDWIAPTDSSPMIGAARLKDVEGFALFETNHDAALTDVLGTPGIGTEAHFFGQDATTTAVVEDPELRSEAPTDLGRKRKVGWVGTIEAGIVWPTSALGRMIVLRST